ncbi:MAG: hypothetical protein JWP80_3238 [Pseudomonas sp.]|nr:hypothetical protein [Pseudomonas sp.]
MPVYAKAHEGRVVPNTENKMKWLVALTRALNGDFAAQAKTPTLMKAAGVKNVNA